MGRLSQHPWPVQTRKPPRPLVRPTSLPISCRQARSIILRRRGRARPSLRETKETRAAPPAPTAVHPTTPDGQLHRRVGQSPRPGPSQPLPEPDRATASQGPVTHGEPNTATTELLRDMVPGALRARQSVAASPRGRRPGPCRAGHRAAAPRFCSPSAPLLSPTVRPVRAESKRSGVGRLAPTRPAGPTETCSSADLLDATRAHRPPGRELLPEHGLGEDRTSVGAGQMPPPHNQASQRERTDREQHPALDGERRHEKPAQRACRSAAVRRELSYSVGGGARHPASENQQGRRAAAGAHRRTPHHP